MIIHGKLTMIQLTMNYVSCIFVGKLFFCSLHQIYEALSVLTDWGQDIAASPVVSLGTVLVATRSGKGKLHITAPVMGPFR